jgi:Osmosensitive K+ channel His kinase sensor domain
MGGNTGACRHGKAVSMTTRQSALPAGRLHVYLGAVPGAGKTRAMLAEGRRLACAGTDVVVALAETHGRPDLAELAAGLQVVPRRDIAYRGTSFAELDVGAVLARRPGVALVDELAHTNVPAARPPGRGAVRGRDRAGPGAGAERRSPDRLRYPAAEGLHRRGTPGPAARPARGSRWPPKAASDRRTAARFARRITRRDYRLPVTLVRPTPRAVSAQAAVSPLTRQKTLPTQDDRGPPGRQYRWHGKPRYVPA